MFSLGYFCVINVLLIVVSIYVADLNFFTLNKHAAVEMLKCVPIL